MIRQNSNRIFTATSVRWHFSECPAVPTYPFRENETGRSGKRHRPNCSIRPSEDRDWDMCLPLSCRRATYYTRTRSV